MAKIIGKTEDGKDVYGLDFDLEVKDITIQEDGKRVVSLIASTPSVDRDGDTIDQKGWDLKYYRKNPVILWAHNHDIPAIARGNKFAVRDDKLTFDEIEFPKEGIHPQADMIFALMQDKFIRACSVGFLPIKYKQREREDGEANVGWFPTKFEKQELLELSVCNVGCNREALSVQLTSKGFRSRMDAKGNLYEVDKFVEELTKDMDFEESKAVIPFKHYPLAEQDETWNGAQEVRDADVATLKSICTWYDSENADVKSSYKLPHHRAEDKYTVWNGVKAAMGALLGARGGVDIPEDERRGTYNHLSKHYTEFDESPPEFKEYSDAELREIFSGEEKEAGITMKLSKEAEELLVSKIQEAKDSFLDDLDKAGAVLSRSNKEKLKNAVEAINAVLAAAEPATVDEEGGDDMKTQPPDEIGMKDVVAKLDLILQAIKKPEVKPDKKSNDTTGNADKSSQLEPQKEVDKIDLDSLEFPDEDKEKSTSKKEDEVDMEMLSKALEELKKEHLTTVKETVQSELRKAMGIVD